VEIKLTNWNKSFIIIIIIIIIIIFIIIIIIMIAILVSSFKFFNETLQNKTICNKIL